MRSYRVEGEDGKREEPVEKRSGMEGSEDEEATILPLSAGGTREFVGANGGAGRRSARRSLKFRRKGTARARTSGREVNLAFLDSDRRCPIGCRISRRD